MSERRRATATTINANLDVLLRTSRSNIDGCDSLRGVIETCAEWKRDDACSVGNIALTLLIGPIGLRGVHIAVGLVGVAKTGGSVGRSQRRSRECGV